MVAIARTLVEPVIDRVGSRAAGVSGRPLLELGYLVHDAPTELDKPGSTANDSMLFQRAGREPEKGCGLMGIEEKHGRLFRQNGRIPSPQSLRLSAFMFLSGHGIVLSRNQAAAVRSLSCGGSVIGGHALGEGDSALSQDLPPP